jgi:squalene-hopene/tetraprenyl-beta-curcumene cyclase
MRKKIISERAVQRSRLFFERINLKEDLMKCVLTLVAAGALFLIYPGSGKCDADSATQAPVELSIQKEGEQAISKGLEWLLAQQMEDGSWSSYPAITALVVSAFLRSPSAGPLGYNHLDTPELAKGLDYILRCVKPNGAIYTDNMPGYNTSVCVMTLMDTGDHSYDEIIKNAREFLIDLQCDEGEGYEPDSVLYGGIGYGGDDRPDLSNLQWALEALKRTEDLSKRVEYDLEGSDDSEPARNLPSKGASGQGIFWDKAILFLERCQNLKSINHQTWAGNDGGFVYYPGYSKAGGTTSYGSMTYAGLKSFIFASVSKEDPRVQAAFDWIRQNYTVDKNPELGLQGLFYYYHTMAKALNAYGEETIKDDSGAKHNWREDLIIKLSSIQHGDGYWVNSNGRWWENNKVLVTAYCVLALEEALGINQDP